MKHLELPRDLERLKTLKAGEEITLTAHILTARDQAHARLVSALSQNRKIPVDLQKQVIYYCGPTPAAPGSVIGSCGPTTSRRMDSFTPALLDQGLAAMIGKGSRSENVVRAIKEHGAVYFLAYAGCGALINRYVSAARPVAYGDLGAEAIYRLAVHDLPLVVGIDSRGRSIYP